MDTLWLKIGFNNQVQSSTQKKKKQSLIRAKTHTHKKKTRIKKLWDQNKNRKAGWELEMMRELQING